MCGYDMNVAVGYTGMDNIRSRLFDRKVVNHLGSLDSDNLALMSIGWHAFGGIRRASLGWTRVHMITALLSCGL